MYIQALRMCSKDQDRCLFHMVPGLHLTMIVVLILVVQCSYENAVTRKTFRFKQKIHTCEEGLRRSVFSGRPRRSLVCRSAGSCRGLQRAAPARCMSANKTKHQDKQSIIRFYLFYFYSFRPPVQQQTAIKCSKFCEHNFFLYFVLLNQPIYFKVYFISYYQVKPFFLLACTVQRKLKFFKFQ